MLYSPAAAKRQQGYTSCSRHIATHIGVYVRLYCFALRPIFNSVFAAAGQATSDKDCKHLLLDVAWRRALLPCMADAWWQNLYSLYVSCLQLVWFCHVRPSFKANRKIKMSRLECALLYKRWFTFMVVAVIPESRSSKLNVRTLDWYHLFKKVAELACQTSPDLLPRSARCGSEI